MIVGRVDFHDAPDEPNPFLRFRPLSQIYQLALLAGMSDGAYVDMVRALDARVAEVDGTGFRVTPVTRLGADRGLWLKHDWQSVSGSHKARHLMGIALYLEVGRAIGARREPPRLAIASCGNAALAAAVVARALDYPLQVFIPEDAKPSVVARLEDLGATITVCPRLADGPPGDPTYHAFGKAVRGGALPFCVQGPDCGLTIEGGRTLGWEIGATLAATPPTLRPNRVVVQVGGGAMASSIAAGLADFVAVDVLDEAPSLFTVQTTGCAPLKRAWDAVEARSVAGGGMSEAVAAAVHHRGDYMWPWETTPTSLAHGILDDETYDWYAVVEAMARTGGRTMLVDDSQLTTARSIAHAAGAPVSYTGAAGLAAALTFDEAARDRTLVVLSGRNRDQESAA